MPDTIELQQESTNQRGFYAPRFELRIEGAGLPGDVLRDVTQVTYKESTTEIDSFELTVNNWDAALNDFKYVGAETNETLKAETDIGKRHRLFEPCNKVVKLSMGYLDELRVMMLGNFTTMEPNFPSSGGPTLTVRGLNVLHELRRKRYSYSWEQKRDSEIALAIADLRDRETGRKRFPIPIVTDPSVLRDEPQLNYIAQKNQFDIDFLLARARARSYVVFIQERDENVRGSQRRLYFGPSEGGRIPGLRDDIYKLEWGKSLIDFKPTLTTANQFKSVRVNGWNRARRQPISVTVTLDDRELNRNQDLYEMLKVCDPREEDIVDVPVFSEQQARRLAIARLKDRQREMVKASGTTIGLPALRAGKQVVLDKVGARFNGTYFVTETTHTIGNGGYTTSFNARRENDTKPRS